MPRRTDPALLLFLLLAVALGYLVGRLDGHRLGREAAMREALQRGYATRLGQHGSNATELVWPDDPRLRP